MPSNIPSNVQTEVVSKPRTIIRMISSKFSARPPPPTVHVELSREQRDAALRARGLIPQQAPRPPPPPEQKLEQGVPSAADIIKQEWAAKNALVRDERERFHSFKFGGPSPPEGQLPSPPGSPVLNEVEVPSRTHSPAPPLRALPTPPDTPLLDAPTGPYLAPPASPPTISLTPPTTSPDEKTAPSEDKALDEKFHHRMDSFAQLEASISSLATLPIVSSPQALWSTTSLPSLITVSESTKPMPSKPLKNLNGLQVKVHEGPLVPLLVESPVDLHFSESPVVLVDESAAEPLESQDVVVVVEEEDKDVSRVVPLLPLRKTTPVISTAAPAATPSSPQRTLITSAPKSPTFSVVTQNSSQSKKQKRGMTDPASGAEAKRKMTNPFKRGDHKSTGKVVDDTVVGVVIGDDTPKAQPRPRRLTMGSSLSNLRRSFVGTLSRPSNSDHKNGKGFDASHLPPSPTIPSSFNAGSPVFPSSTTRSRSRGGSGGSSSNEGKLTVPISPRVCQNIAMHNHGTIQSETAAIEDDEMRRMTELAFLG